jgi:hypothetical protein
MGNTVVWTLTVKGDGRDKVRTLFEENSEPTDWGIVWTIPGCNEAIAANLKHGGNPPDGIRTEGDALIIKGEAKWSPPLTLVEMLAQRWPELDFVIWSWELTNGWCQRWCFKGQDDWLLDVYENPMYEDQELVVYVRDGVQFRPLPDWVPADDPGMPEGPAPVYDRAAGESAWPAPEIEAIMQEMERGNSPQ